MIPLKYNLRSLAVRKRTTAAAVGGIALVVAVLSAALMLNNGIKKTMGGAGKRDTAIVLRRGSQAELESGIEEAQVALVTAAPGVKHDGASNAPIGSGELVVVAAMDKLGTTGIANVQIRGVRDNVMLLRPEVRLLEGRLPKPGADEAMVGRRIRGRFRNVDLDRSFEIKKNRMVKVVGIFEAEGSSFESEVWSDLDTVRTSFGRDGLVSSVRVKLESPDKFDAFKDAIEQDKQVAMTALRETDYFEKASSQTSNFVIGLGIMVSIFFSMGAMIGAMITMYAAVSNRQREIGTLRALGFSRRSILFSFLLESTALAMVGGAIGAGASMAMGLVHFSMMNFSSWSEMVFSFEPTPKVILTALGFAAFMGLAGGFFPALRAARLSPLAAIRGE